MQDAPIGLLLRRPACTFEAQVLRMQSVLLSMCTSYFINRIFAGTHAIGIGTNDIRKLGGRRGAGPCGWLGKKDCCLQLEGSSVL